MSDLFIKGARVIVRGAGGASSKNVVWEDHGDMVMVCSERQFKKLIGGYPAPMPIGFRRADVEKLNWVREV